MRRIRIKSIHLAVTFVLILAVSSSLPPKSTSGVDQMKKLNDNTKFQCNIYASDSKNYTVSWQKYQGQLPPLILSNGTSLIIPDTRFEIVYNNVTLSYDFKINKIQESDDGYYQCVVGRNSSMFSIRSQVKLYVRQTFLVENSAQEIVKNENETINLGCFIADSLESEISWRRENDIRLPNGNNISKGNVLTITSLRLEDRGVYICKADNRKHKIIYRRITIFVRTKPIVLIANPVKSKTISQSLDIGCHVIAYPHADIYWKKDGKEFLTNSERRASVSRMKKDEYQSSIYIFSIRKNDYGNYTCEAVNDIGKTKAEAIVVEKFSTG